MRISTIVPMLFLGGVLSLSFSQDSVQITGTISDGTNGLSQAFVLLKSAQLSVETGPSGAFSITRSASSTGAMAPRRSVKNDLSLSEHNGHILLRLPNTFEKVQIRLHDIQGRLLSQNVFSGTKIGAIIDLANGYFPPLNSGQYIASVTSGSTTTAYRVLSIDGKLSVTTQGRPAQQMTSLAKCMAEAIADTLIVNRIGYYPRRIPLVSYTADFSGTNSIVMEKSRIPCIDVGGLLLGFVNQFDAAWWDAGSGQDWDGSFWNPRVDSSDGFKALGTYGKNIWADPTGKAYVMVVKTTDTSSHALAAPVDYIKLCEVNANATGSFWQPVPPAGFVACGVVAVSGTAKPSLDLVACVREDLTTIGTVSTHFWYSVSLFEPTRLYCSIIPKQVPTFGSFPLATGTFTTYVTGSVPEVHCLNVKLPMAMENTVPPVLPKLSGLIEPPNETTPHFARVMMVPFSVINDTTVDNAWQVANVPFYRVERYQFYHKLFYMINNGASDWPWSEAITTGMTQEQSERFWHTTGISVTANAGFSFNGFSGGLSVTVSQEFGYESSSSISIYESKTVTKTATVPAHSIGVLWQKNDLVLMKRCNEAGECQVVGSETVPLESYYYDEIPFP